MHEQKIHAYSLGGDNLRRGLTKELTFSEADRNKNSRRTAEVAKLFIDAGTVVITTFISPYIDMREQINVIVGKENYMEVFVNTPLNVCEQRDLKGLYK